MRVELSALERRVSVGPRNSLELSAQCYLILAFSLMDGRPQNFQYGGVSLKLYLIKTKPRSESSFLTTTYLLQKT